MDAEGDASQHLEEDIAQGVDFVDVGGEGDGDEGDAGAQGGYAQDVTKIHGGKRLTHRSRPRSVRSDA